MGEWTALAAVLFDTGKSIVSCDKSVAIPLSDKGCDCALDVANIKPENRICQLACVQRDLRCYIFWKKFANLLS